MEEKQIWNDEVFNVGYRIGSPGFRIGYRVFGSDHRIFGSGPLKFLKNPNPYPIRKPEIFSGYPIRNIRNLKIGSDIRNFGSDQRIFGSDISDRIFLHTPTGNITGFAITSQDINWSNFLRIHGRTVRGCGSVGASVVVQSKL